MIDVLSKLFGSVARVKILRLFLANKNATLTGAEVAKRTKVQIKIVRKELAVFTKILLLKESSCIRLSSSEKKKRAAKQKTEKCFALNNDFSYLSALTNLILEKTDGDNNFVEEQLNGIGKVKLLAMTGLFVHGAQNAQVDILIVADNVKQNKVETAIREIESRLGQEIRFALFSSEDFTYRMDIYDKLVRDIFDYPHELVIDKIALQF